MPSRDLLHEYCHPSGPWWEWLFSRVLMARSCWYFFWPLAMRNSDHVESCSGTLMTFLISLISCMVIIMNAWHYNECMKSLRRNSTKSMNQWHYNESMMNSCMTEKKNSNTYASTSCARARIFLDGCSRHTPSSLLLRSIQHNHPSMSLLMLLLSVFTSLSDEEGSEWKSSEQCNHYGSFTLRPALLVSSVVWRNYYLWRGC